MEELGLVGEITDNERGEKSRKHAVCFRRFRERERGGNVAKGKKYQSGASGLL
jgi:hypothetical protein